MPKKKSSGAGATAVLSIRDSGGLWTVAFLVHAAGGEWVFALTQRQRMRFLDHAASGRYAHSMDGSKGNRSIGREGIFPLAFVKNGVKNGILEQFFGDVNP